MKVTATRCRRFLLGALLLVTVYICIASPLYAQNSSRVCTVGGPDNTLVVRMLQRINVRNRTVGPFPAIFEHSNFRGDFRVLNASSRELADQSFANTASSVCVPPGWSVRLYRHRDYEGESLYLEGGRYGDEENDLKGHVLQDRISSVIVWDSNGDVLDAAPSW